MKNKSHSFSLIPLIVNFFFLLFYYVLFQTQTFTQLIYILPTLVLFFLSGEFIFKRIYSQIKIDNTLQYALSVFTGGIFIYLFIILLKWINFDNSKVFIFFTIQLLSLLYFYKRCKFHIESHSKYYYILIIFIFLLSLSGINLYESISSHPIEQNRLMDNYFYTSIVSSLRSGTIFNSSFEITSPLNYHIGGFLWPAAVSEITQISSHSSLWQIFIPFGRFLSLYFIAYIISIFVQLRKGSANLFISMFLGLFLFIGLSSINPKFLLNFDLRNMLWVGTPFTVPDKPALISSLIICLFLILLLLRIRKWTINNMIAFIALYSTLIVFKVTSFFVFSSLFGFWSLWQIFYQKDSTYIRLIVLSILPTFSLYYIVYINDYSNISFLYSPGYLISYFNKLAGINSNSSFYLFKGLGIFLVTFSIWIGIKFIGLNILIKQFKNKFIPMFGSFTLTFIVLIVFSSLFKIHVINAAHKELYDISYDLMQFFKFFMIFISILASAGFLYAFYSFGKTKRVSFVLFTLAYSILPFASLFALNFPRQHYNENDWARVVNEECQKEKFGMLSTVPSTKYPGQLLSAYDIGPWLVLIDNRVGGYTTSFKNDSNRLLMNTLITSKDSTLTIETIKKLKAKGVTNFISNPEIDAVFQELLKENILTKAPENIWFYSINK